MICAHKTKETLFVEGNVTTYLCPDCGTVIRVPELMTPSNDCCEWWLMFAKKFLWMVVADQPELLVMPHVVDDATGKKWRVNHCPGCGANVRDRVILASRIEEE